VVAIKLDGDNGKVTTLKEGLSGGPVAVTLVGRYRVRAGRPAQPDDASESRRKADAVPCGGRACEVMFLYKLGDPDPERRMRDNSHPAFLFGERAFGLNPTAWTAPLASSGTTTEA
jgi:hypothetical protein